jgi:membrane protease YdiL (CAAX protease family)
MVDKKPLSFSQKPDSPILANEPTWVGAALPVQAEPSSTAASDSQAEIPRLIVPPTDGAGRDFPLRDVFLGSTGLYPGVRWLIYLAMAFVVFQVEGWLVLPFKSQMGDLWWRVTIEAGMTLAAILPGFAMARVEGCGFAEFGLPATRAFGRNFWIGTLWGIASLTVLMLTLRIAGAFEFGSLALHGARIWKFAAYYGALFLLTGFFEDFLMRGYSQWVLSRGMYFWPAAALLSVAFGYIHGGNAGESTTGLVATGLIGFFLCLTLRRTGDLWWAVGFHMAWDWGESYLYSVPDSGAVLPGHLLNSSFHGPDWLTGGTVGPEGSYLVFVVIGALWVLFDRAYPEVKYVSGGDEALPRPDEP